jgi:hypothetical protein
MAPAPPRAGAREHLGHGRLALDPSRAVFINCPYDPEYQPTFDALIFAVVCCGFIPRSALETGSVADPRMERIVRAIFTSRYSIHDLSRCRGEGTEMLARFNMPLELGMAMARWYMDRRKQERHDWAVLVPDGHHYVKFVSDLAGFDLLRYDGTTEGAVPKVMSWLATRPGMIRSRKPREVLAALPRFQAEKQRLIAEWQGEIPWADLLIAAIEISESLP